MKATDTRSHFGSGSIIGILFLLTLFLQQADAQGQEASPGVLLKISTVGASADTGTVQSPSVRLSADSIAPISYPAEALASGLNGIIILKILVEADGTIKELQALYNGGDGREALLRASVDGLRGAEFLPGTVNGTPTRMWVIAEVKFLSTSDESLTPMEDVVNPVAGEYPKSTWEYYYKSDVAAHIVPHEFYNDGERQNYEEYAERYYSESHAPPGIEAPIYDYEELASLIEYPELARQYGVEGFVIVNAGIGADGTVLQTELRYSSSHLLEKSALAAVKNLEFVPGTENGRPTRMWKEVFVRFQLPKSEQPEMFSDEPGMDDFIPDATFPTYDQAELTTLLRNELPPSITEGKIVLSAHIDTDGSVLQVVMRSTTDPALTTPAVNAVKKGTFSSGMQHGNPIRLWVRIPLTVENISSGK